MSSRHSSCQRKGETVRVSSVSVLKDNFYLQVIAVQNEWHANKLKHC